MFNASGNSSKDVDLNHLPNDVNLTSSDNRFPFSSFSSVIVLNLYNSNTSPFLPGLFCLKITGLPSFSFTNNATVKYIGEKTVKAPIEHTTSIVLLGVVS